MDTRSGTVRGVIEDDMAHWRGIPYSAPPVGPLRWRAPQPHAGWPDVREAAEFGAWCPQPRASGLLGADRSTRLDEDCLTLNVSALAEPHEPRSPVMVFIHGGAFVNGSGSAPFYDGSPLVRRGEVVYVSINYRLGALGWLHFDEYATDERPIESNLGLRDIIAALAWIGDNIAAFGGDPDNITIFGESAGAIAITTLLACPRAEGLFHRAIVQSSAPRVIPTMEQAHRWTKEFLQYLVIDVDNRAEVLDTLEEVTPLELSVALSRLSASGLKDEPAAIAVCPAADGYLLPRLPVAAIAAGQGLKVPLIIGTNDREGTLFSHFSPTNPGLRPTWKQMVTKAHSFVDPQGDFDHPDTDESPPAAVLRDLYPSYPKRGALADLAGDGAFWYPSIEVMEGHSTYAPTWAYRYDFAPRLIRMVGVNATHAAELLPLFEQYRTSEMGRRMTRLGGNREYEKLTEYMQVQWLHFARFGEPLEDWEPYEVAQRATMIFDTTCRVELDPRRERRLAWRALEHV